MTNLIPIATITVILIVGVVVLCKRASSGGADGNGGSRGRPGADKH